MYKFLFVVGIFATVHACSTKDVVSEERSGCNKYASSFSCNYVETKATYTVAYWKDVEKNDPKDEQIVGTAIGLSKCRDTAIFAHRTEMNYRRFNWKNWGDRDNWTERSYICILTKDGRWLEKHRY